MRVGLFQQTFASAGRAISALILSISMLSFVSLVFSSVLALRPSVRVLSSMGITKASANAIYLAETNGIALICSLLSIAPYVLLTNWASSYVASEIHMPIAAFSSSPLIWAIGALGLMAVATLATLLASAWSMRRRGKRDGDLA